MKELVLPKENNNETIEASQSILFIGANGSGKTRLGTWIEIDSPQKELVHRISAQKSLSLPDSTTPQSIDLAEKDLLFGNPQWNYLHKTNKFSQKPATAFLDDYQKLMVYLFSDETEENAKFKRACKDSDERVTPPTTKIDLVKELWETILPHRELIIGGLRIQTRVKGQEDKIYNSSEMSDGERVIFYLIVQCLSASKDGIIVIDEPELHLHKSVQAPLWDAVEKLRAEVENLFCAKEVLEIISNRIARNPATDFQTVSNNIFTKLQSELDTQVSLRTSSEVKFQLNMFDANQKGANDINGALQSLIANIDVNQIYSDIHALYSSVVQNNDYEQLLALYNRKSLSSQVSNSLGLANGSLPETVIRLIRSDCKESITNALKPYFGNFQQHMA